MKIYTKTGDEGMTSLANGQRVSKAQSQIEAYGTVDELNAAVGWLRAIHDTEQLCWIQHRLFDLGATLAQASLHLSAEDSEQLEQWIDAYQSQLPPLRDFVLPAGSEGACRSHICRTITRRLERIMVGCNHQDEWSNELVFVNRLSDFFFVFSRYLCVKDGKNEEKWQKR